MNDVRYGLKGFRLETGELSLQPRHPARTKEGVPATGQSTKETPPSGPQLPGATAQAAIHTLAGSTSHAA